jgi:hypothetical protein
MQYVWNNFGNVGFLFSVYQYIHLTFLFILIVFHVLKPGRWTSIVQVLAHAACGRYNRISVVNLIGL